MRLFALGIVCSLAISRALASEPMVGLPQVRDGAWLVRFNAPAAQRAFVTTTRADGFSVETKTVAANTEDLYVFYHLTLEQPVSALAFDYALNGDAAKMPLVLFDAAANELWRHDGQGAPPPRVSLANLRVRGQLVFRVRRDRGGQLAEGWSHRVSNLKRTAGSRAPVVAADGFTVVDTLDELRGYASRHGVKVRLKPGTYTLDRALVRHFIEFTGDDSQWDLRGATIRIDTRLFRQFGGGGLYCVFSLAGDRIEFSGVTTENYGDLPGLQSRNKIFNITGVGVVVRDVDITTSGSSPWGYGSLYGISGGDVRKMNGIRVGWPATDVKLLGCRVHMRAMGHAIFVQGADRTLIRDCHVDGLLKTTDDILAEKSGYAFEHQFTARGRGYIEGVTVGDDGKILPGEMISLSEDGIRLYPESGPGQPTGRTTIENCTVTRMRRGICTGLGRAADMVVNCEARECVAAGFNAGSGDVLRHCRADAKYAEALCLPYSNSRGADAEIEILDSRDGCANALLAAINGVQHRVVVRTRNPDFLPPAMTIELASTKGYARYRQVEPVAKNIRLTNETPAPVLLTPTATSNDITSRGPVTDRGEPRNTVHVP